ncbi:MAG: hypothetical protein OQK77_10090, partial [Psychromonas sp.]|nr:hypothetical protein [Psychromonas sp.]
PYDNELVNRLILALNGEMSRPELKKSVGVKDIGHFREGYLVPALELNIIEMTLPDKPKSKNQRYRLTKKGISLQKQLIK